MYTTHSRTYLFDYDQLSRAHDIPDARIIMIVHLLASDPRPVHDLYATVIDCAPELHVWISLCCYS